MKVAVSVGVKEGVAVAAGSVGGAIVQVTLGVIVAVGGLTVGTLVGVGDGEAVNVLVATFGTQMTCPVRMKSFSRQLASISCVTEMR